MEQLLKLVWSPSEIYVCGDPDCRSKVLILQSPQKDPRSPTLPRCVCGSILEVSGSIEGVHDVKPRASQCFDQDNRE
jgi:hypothetical protein